MEEDPVADLQGYQRTPRKVFPARKESMDQSKTIRK